MNLITDDVTKCPKAATPKFVSDFRYFGPLDYKFDESTHHAEQQSTQDKVVKYDDSVAWT